MLRLFSFFSEIYNNSAHFILQGFFIFSFFDLKLKTFRQKFGTIDLKRKIEESTQNFLKYIEKKTNLNNEKRCDENED